MTSKNTRDTQAQARAADWAAKTAPARAIVAQSHEIDACVTEGLEAYYRWLRKPTDAIVNPATTGDTPTIPDLKINGDEIIYTVRMFKQGVDKGTVVVRLRRYKGVLVETNTLTSFLTMQTAALAAGYEIDLKNANNGNGVDPDAAFRLFEQQLALYNKYSSKTGNLAADPRYNTSNHQFGIALDINPGVRGADYRALVPVGKNETNTPAMHARRAELAEKQYPVFGWLRQNGPTYHFTHVEGQRIDEPWHWVYRTAPAPNGTIAPPDERPATPPPTIAAVVATGHDNASTRATSPGRSDGDRKTARAVGNALAAANASRGGNSRNQAMAAAAAQGAKSALKTSAGGAAPVAGGGGSSGQAAAARSTGTQQQETASRVAVAIFSGNEVLNGYDFSRGVWLPDEGVV